MPRGGELFSWRTWCFNQASIIIFVSFVGKVESYYVLRTCYMYSTYTDRRRIGWIFDSIWYDTYCLTYVFSISEYSCMRISVNATVVCRMRTCRRFFIPFLWVRACMLQVATCYLLRVRASNCRYCLDRSGIIIIEIFYRYNSRVLLVNLHQTYRDWGQRN